MPYDGALHAANGALFCSLYSELPEFIAAPVDWLYDYYNQYPALSIRRHPPLFPVLEGLLFQITGVTVFGARLTIVLFALALCLAMYSAMWRLFKDDVIAASVVLLFFTAPEVRYLLVSVWADLPALAFACWGLSLYGKRLCDGDVGAKNTVLMAIAFALSLYCYQLTIVFIAGLLLHFVVSEYHTWWKDRRVLFAAGLFVLLIIPWAAQVLYAQKDDNLAMVAGSATADFSVFVPVADKTSASYWTYYAKTLWVRFPAHVVGVALWTLLCAFRRPSRGEWLCVTCFVVSYLAFSWVPAKVDRYSVYVALPASPLAVLAVRDIIMLVGRIGDRVRGWILICVVGLAATVQAALLRPHLVDVVDMNRVVDRVMAASSNPRALYCGHLDGAFVFYVRCADLDRRARVYRATVQVKDAKELEEFIKNERIDLIVVEHREGARKSAWTVFSDAINEMMRTSSAFSLHEEQSVLLTGPRADERVRIAIYLRRQNVEAGSDRTDATP
jgi:4-amino-4-deoxy-L-arabinose transferase-like glycosyltransferase